MPIRNRIKYLTLVGLLSFKVLLPGRKKGEKQYVPYIYIWLKKIVDFEIFHRSIIYYLSIDQNIKNNTEKSQHPFY